MGPRLRGKLKMLRVLLIVGVTVATVITSSACTKAKTPEYPTQPITIINTFAAGNTNDVICRLVAPKLSKLWKDTPINIVSKPGGAGTVGTLEVMKSKTDGYTILSDCPASSSIQDALFDSLPYKVSERTYISRIAFVPLLIVVPSTSPWKNLEDVVNAIKADPANFRFASAGGTAAHDVVLMQLKAALTAKGIDLSKTKTVPFEGVATVMPALAGGHVDISAQTPPSSLPMINAGKVRVIAAVGDQRYKDFPDVQSTSEQGFPSVNLTFWLGFSGPPGTPDYVVKAWNDGLAQVMKDPELVAELAKVGAVPAYQPSADYAKFVADEAAAIKASSGK